MIDPHLLRNKLDELSEKLTNKKFILDVKTFRQQEKCRKILQIKTETLQAKRNARSKNVGDAKSRGEDINLLLLEIATLNECLNIAKSELDLLKNQIHDFILSIPNIPDDKVPIGFNESDNLEIMRWGTPRHYDFPIRDHIELGEIAGGLHFSSGVKLTGSRFVVMSGYIARMHRALTQFMIDLHIDQHGYQEYYLPYLVNYTSLYGTAQLPKFSEDLFHIQPLSEQSETKSYALIPTAEVPLTNLLRDEIIDEDALPIKMSAHTPCFRSEAGSYGRDSRGLIRMHQFDKVEIVQIVKPEQSMQALEEMTNHAEKVLQLLELPYRKVLLCTGVIGFASCKTYDLEVWLPAQNTYREVSSCSNMSDFQARRMKARYRSNYNKKIHFVHTLNGSGLAVGRTLVAVLENYQLSDGRVELPSILKPYM